MFIAHTESKHLVKLDTEHAPYTNVGIINKVLKKIKSRTFIFSLPKKYIKNHILNQRKNTNVYISKNSGQGIIFCARLFLSERMNS